VTGRAGRGGLGVTMTTKTGGRVDPTVDTMTAEVIPAVRHTAGIVGLILERRFKLDPGGVAVVAEAGLVAECADPLSLIGGLTMTFTPGWTMDKTFEGDVATGIMTVGTDLRLFTEILW